MQQIHIIGTGAMGCLWGSYFPVKTRLSFIARSFDSDKFRYKISPQNKWITASIERSDHTAPIQHLIVATKAFDSVEAVRSIEKRLKSNTQILVLQNGMGSQQAIAQAYSHLPVFACSSTEGAYKTSATELVHAGRGINVIGPLTAHANARILSHWLPSQCFQWSDDIQSVLWRKLLVNCAINPLTVLFNCKNGELTKIPDAVHLMKAICDEMDLLTSQLNLNLPSSYGLAHSVCERTAQNYSSMYQDAHHKRQTEIDFITGYLVQQCKKLNIACPANELVLSKIKNLHLGDPSDLG